MSEEAREKKALSTANATAVILGGGGLFPSPLGEYRGFGGVERIWKFSRVAFRDLTSETSYGDPG